ncbi:alginate lyase family protein [Thalassotalea sp. PS06]|uniref:alginate lyase family protein n=1 Tax=Thalassotalea sp. PS06 TaxID=2594005 RepID=UPI001163BFB3|nr:alginate lyase family protein [Thalassotalea sp. PS06]
MSVQGVAKAADNNAHPRLVVSASDVPQMQKAIEQAGSFQQAFTALKSQVDSQLQHAINIPVPNDAGGGFTHEQHKRNYRLMHDAGILFQLTQDKKYADHAIAMLEGYAKMYPDLPLHPKQKEQAPGRLFWQSLNEAVFLVYTIQGYDFVYDYASKAQRETIENGLFRPIAKFLSSDSPQTFDKIHNHGTWATAAVGMTGLVLGEDEWVEQALYGLDKSGTGGFMRQLDELFSPQGYYTEGPYYQRYALMPFVLFAKSVEVNQPERKIFEYRDSILLKAIDTTIQLSYDRLFFPINDAIKDKGIDTVELVYGVTIAYGLTNNAQLLDIAKQQDQVLLTGDGLNVAQAIDAGKAQPYHFASKEFGDGQDGKQGALVVMRANQDDKTAPEKHQAVVFKATAQGMGHGHFDKLNWIFYDNGHEVVSDYGAARFLNVEAKYGGHYLKENKSYAKQTIAHNTLVVAERSHFKGNTKRGNQYSPEVTLFDTDENLSISSAFIDTAYKGVAMRRTQALVSVEGRDLPVVIDVFNVRGDKKRQYDLPLHFNGHLMDTTATLKSNTTSLAPLGSRDGYQHLWLTAEAKPEQPLSKVTWLNDDRFYTMSTKTLDGMKLLFTRTGANDPDFNLREDKAFIYRLDKAKDVDFVSLLEVHGEYNPSKEFTLEAHSQLEGLDYTTEGDVQVVSFKLQGSPAMILAFAPEGKTEQEYQFSYQGQQYKFSGQYALLSQQ